jgi:hypothetical protein
MYFLPYASDRTDHRQRKRSQPHLPIHQPRNDGQIQDSEPLHRLPQRQVHGLGNSANENLVECFTLACRTVIGERLHPARFSSFVTGASRAIGAATAVKLALLGSDCSELSKQERTPICLNCSEGCLGSAFNKPNALSACV